MHRIKELKVLDSLLHQAAAQMANLVVLVQCMRVECRHKTPTADHDIQHRKTNHGSSPDSQPMVHLIRRHLKMIVNHTNCNLARSYPRNCCWKADPRKCLDALNLRLQMYFVYFQLWLERQISLSIFPLHIVSVLF